jgi:hypothetical protein
MNIRHVILVIISVSLIAFGLRLAWGQAICALGMVEYTCFYGGLGAYGAAVLIVVGFYLMWEDILFPLWTKLRRK